MIWRSFILRLTLRSYIGGTGEGQHDAAWLIPLCLQLFPAVILGIGMVCVSGRPHLFASHLTHTDLYAVQPQVVGSSWTRERGKEDSR
jgi:hypothetical protein